MGAFLSSCSEGTNNEVFGHGNRNNFSLSKEESLFAGSVLFPTAHCCFRIAHQDLGRREMVKRKSSRGDFVFSADRLIRLVVEEGLNQLPYTECTVTTPTGHKYEGVRFEKGNCGVSIMRSGEAMEQGLRDCCRSIRIGKILIQSDEETQRAKVYYAKFPPDIYRRKVLLMYPILSTGNTVIEAVKVLVEHGVQPSVIILLSLFSTPHGAKSIIQEFPEITILTTEVHPVAPTHFGQKYFGTD
ncbi:uracil phosphoribosyltransferase homolog isoform X3 [Catharus ustulatus]|uniref:uracil phosphoribosyltransferase homolog isoform X3 n=1 Tax=Catharus ustulatus TaxID=91951 RepID=UPI0014079964|nr:uracil phosphoribosyltransferase homolog isoform X3 [Catharus ustulatus]